jgi:hypothetical protein
MGTLVLFPRRTRKVAITNVQGALRRSIIGLEPARPVSCAIIRGARGSSRPLGPTRNCMVLDKDRIDRAVLALLYLGLHDGARAWKGFDWEAMDRLHQKGLISDPRSKAKSIVFTEEGLEEARRALEQMFSA